MKTKFRIKHQLWKHFFFILLIAFHAHHLGLSRPSPINVHHRTSEDSASKSDRSHAQVTKRPVHYYDLTNVGPTEIFYTMRGDRKRLIQNNDTLVLYLDGKDFMGLVSGRDVVQLVNDDDDDDDVIDNDATGDVIDPVSGSRSDRNLVRRRRQVFERLFKNRSDDNDTLVLRKGFISARDVEDVINDVEDTPTLEDDVDLDVIDLEEVHRRRHQGVGGKDRNLVRKRRQQDPQRPHRRHRRRKHRLVLKARDRNHLEDDDDQTKDRRDRFLIKSDSPGYFITSASEVKKDWCRTIPLRQKVSEPHCRSRVVQNNFCYGQCNSFFIPHTGRTDKKVAFQSCAFCKPFKQHWGNVTLNCPGRNPPKIEKTVLFVETCKCITEVFQ